MMELELATTGTPRVLSIYSFRFDAHLVADLRKNTAPFVDGWLSWDDRSGQGPFTDEMSRRWALLNAAREAGAQWVMLLDPDERVERRFRRDYRSLLDSGANLVSFRLREMYTPTAYRVDGVWDQKRQGRLLNVQEALVQPQAAPGSLHVPWRSYLAAPRELETGFNVYHLKQIDPQRRRARARLYSELDPQRRMQSIGYDYLADDTGLVLKRVSRRHRFAPRHVDDGGLWMAPEVGDDSGPSA